MAKKWHGTDHEKASAEGWVLSDRSDGWWEVQRFDDDPQETFASDDDAQAHVVARAKEGSPVHRKAVDMHGTPTGRHKIAKGETFYRLT